MTFAWTDLLTFASELVGSHATVEEAKHRGAVTRSYYAVFNQTKEVLHKSGTYIPARDGSDHGKVRDKLRGFPRTSPRGKVEAILDRLYKGRVRAEYQSDSTVTGGDADAAVEQAKLGFELIEKF